MSQAAQSAAPEWEASPSPLGAGWAKVMMWCFIITDGLLFAAFLASYGYARVMSVSWPDPMAVFSLPFLATMTFVLISSSATMASAVAAAQLRDHGLARRFVLATLALGLVFLVMQGLEWGTLIGEGATPATNPWGDGLFGAYFFAITGFHGSHVVIGAGVLGWLAWSMADRETPPARVELVGLYWHFVDLVWVFIFTLFYVL